MRLLSGRLTRRALRITSTAAAGACIAWPASAQCSLQETWKGEVISESARDYAMKRPSATGRYRLTIQPRGDTIPVSKIHSWVLHIETAGGTPVDSAAICIDGGMPEHGHGLPTRPRMTENLKNGDYLIEGMKFSMRGWWVVKFTVTTPAGADSVRFNLSLK
jgi:hypothetical protein